VRLADGSLRTMAEARQNYPDFEITRSWNLDPTILPEAGESIADYLRRIGFSETQIAYTRRSWGNANGAPLEQIDALAALQDMEVLPTPGADPAGKQDFRIVEGYNRLHDYLAQGADIRLNTVVTAVRWGETPIRIETRAGETYTAERVLITLPLGVLQADRVQFDPPLPAEKRGAIHALAMGRGLKIAFSFDHAPAPGIEALYTPHNPPMWWSPDPRVWLCFCTGAWYDELIGDGEAAAINRAFAVFKHELNQPDLTYASARLIDWTRDEFALGAYSSTPVGAVGARERLGAPIDDRLFWAGEAAAPQPYAGTVHGAYVTGLRAAQELFAAFDL